MVAQYFRSSVYLRGAARRARLAHRRPAATLPRAPTGQRRCAQRPLARVRSAPRRLARAAHAPRRQVRVRRLARHVKHEDARVRFVVVAGVHAGEALLAGRVPKVDRDLGAVNLGVVAVQVEREGGALTRVVLVLQEAHEQLGLAGGGVAEQDDLRGADRGSARESRRRLTPFAVRRRAFKSAGAMPAARSSSTSSSSTAPVPAAATPAPPAALAGSAIAGDRRHAKTAECECARRGARGASVADPLLLRW